MEYHRNAFGHAVTDKALQWCGLFCLAMLHDAGIATNVFWRQGGGFCEEQKLGKTNAPQPGDIAYYDKPYHHHAMVIAVDLEAGTYDTVDGNQLGDTVAIHRGIKLTKPTFFYSIGKLLPPGGDDV